MKVIDAIVVVLITSLLSLPCRAWLHLGSSPPRLSVAVSSVDRFYSSATLFSTKSTSSLSPSRQILTSSSSLSLAPSPAAAETNELTDDKTKPTVGSIVTIECDLRPQDGWIPDILMDGITLHADETLRHRLTFLLGDESNGFYPLPGLHQLVLTMQVGDYVEASLDAGWGDRNPNLVVTIRKEDLKARFDDMSQLREGVQLVLGQGRQVCVITQVTDDTITIDANPPLAGSSYLASVKLIRVEEAPVQLEYNNDNQDSSSSATSRYEVATFALGCFWGGDLAFMRQPGVVGTKVGYTQGAVEHPTYEQVCSGTTGHTEAIQIIYDPSVVSYQALVQLAMDRLGENKYRLNQVGNDRGSQYRHGVYYHSDSQRKVAQDIIQCYGEACVTECLPATKFWDAEAYHQQYLYKGGQSAKKGESTCIRCYG